MLPPNWQETELGNVVVPSTESVPASSLDDSTPYLGLEHVESSTARLLGRGVCSNLKGNVRLFHRGDVLYAALRPYLNKVLIPDFDGGCSTEFFVFTQSIALHNRFLLHLLNSPATVQFSTGASRGTNLPRINYDALAAMRIWLPPLAEQVRIAAKLDELSDRIYSAGQRLDAITTLVERFRAAALAETYGVWPRDESSGAIASDLPRLSTEWDWRLAHEVVSADITYGILQPGPRLTVGVPYVSSQDISDEGIRISELAKTSPSIASAYPRSELKEGDVLLGIIRNIKVAVAPLELRGANISRSVARLRPIDDIDSEYLAGWLRSPFAQNWLQARARGIDMPVINLRDVRALPIPVPSLSTQKQILGRIQEVIGASTTFTASIENAKASLKRLRAEVTHLALTGRLLPQEPDDKPAPLFTRDERDAMQRDAKQKAKSRRPAMRSRPRGPRQNIADVLRQSGPLPPEEVLAACGYDADSIDEFFADLRREVLIGAVAEQRQNDGITLIAIEAAS